MVKSEQIYSPQNYLEAVTGNCYIIRGDNDIEEIEKILEDLSPDAVMCLINTVLFDAEWATPYNLNLPNAVRG